MNSRRSKFNRVAGDVKIGRVGVGATVTVVLAFEVTVVVQLVEEVVQMVVVTHLLAAQTNPAPNFEAQ
jgi:hypothetical protein